MTHFTRIVDEIRPLGFLMENVPGLAAPGNLQYLRALVAELTALGYQVDYRILDATAYGVPQRRLRLFVVGAMSRPCVHVAIGHQWPGNPISHPDSR